MNHHKTSGAFEMNTRLVTTGAVLMAGGAMLAFSGMAMAGYALVCAGRRWTREMQLHPSERAAAKLRQAKHASMAGMEAWHAAGNGAT
ncbi:hypothetical protein [Wenjunlia tyrosinilytica]|uniref:Uncharacterized protein n=1 Tax=Wenjunlia tyrosinilytica TaxID=1544741 RepID=A0A917ZJM1_9ACTN|nr:hypothetical protein [Wenjunlia tyrosinilytica]GGO84311.1 hypothetical protein GCM10012280_15500 [Wenjunlia tyrosinilytica]